MKKTFILFAVLIFLTANVAFSTPVPLPESNANINGTLDLANIQSFNFTRNWQKPSMPRFDFDDYKIPDMEKITIIPPWRPSWLPAPSRHYWSKRFRGSIGGEYDISIKRRGDNTPSPVPEPATMLLFGAGLIGLTLVTRKKKNR